MSYQVLARKWRPRNFEAVAGQEQSLRALTRALDLQRVHHAYIFSGTRGVGKTTIGRIVAKALNCDNGVSATPCGVCQACRAIDAGNFVDLIEVDAASRTGVDETRELLENTGYKPVAGRYKVYLIDEVHMFSRHSFNALLKTLEEPPPHVVFILATTDPQKIPVTVRSRCLQFHLRRIEERAIIEQLARIADDEGVTYETAALQRIATAADGSMRDAISLLDQVIAFQDDGVSADVVHQLLGTLDGAAVAMLLQALNDDDGQAIIAECTRLDANGAHFGLVLDEVLRWLHGIAIIQVVGSADAVREEERETLTALARTLSPPQVQLYYEIGMRGRRTLDAAPNARIGFEMTILRMLAFTPDDGDQTPPPAKPVSRTTNTPVNTPTNTPASAPAKAPTVSPAQQVAPVEQRVASMQTMPTIRQEDAVTSAEQWLGWIDKMSPAAADLAVYTLPLQWDGDTGIVTLAIDNDHRAWVSSLREQALAEALARLLDRPSVMLTVTVAAMRARVPQQLRDEQARRDAAQHRAQILAHPFIQRFRDVWPDAHCLAVSGGR